MYFSRDIDNLDYIWRQLTGKNIKAVMSAVFGYMLKGNQVYKTNPDNTIKTDAHGYEWFIDYMLDNFDDIHNIPDEQLGFVGFLVGFPRPPLSLNIANDRSMLYAKEYGPEPRGFATHFAPTDSDAGVLTGEYVSPDKSADSADYVDDTEYRKMLDIIFRSSDRKEGGKRRTGLDIVDQICAEYLYDIVAGNKIYRYKIHYQNEQSTSFNPQNGQFIIEQMNTNVPARLKAQILLNYFYTTSIRYTIVQTVSENIQNAA